MSNLITHIGFSIDESGSVLSIVKDIINSYNNTVKDIRNDIINEGQKASMTAVTFGNEFATHRTLYTAEQVQVVEPLKYDDLRPWGMTPLFDSVYRLIKILEEFDNGDKNVSFIVSVFTDGEENSSSFPGTKETLKKIKEKMNTGRWTFTFLMPKIYISSFAAKYSEIPRTNIQGFDVTTLGIETAFKTQSASYANYFKQKTQGIISTDNFYTDLSNATVREVRTNLSEITKQVKCFYVKETSDIQNFVLTKTNLPFTKGPFFYQLTKTEKVVQDYKLIVIRAKSSGKFYSGSQARQMLGIPEVGNVKLIPGDHGKFDVFIQSTSSNRKLLAGTELVYWENFGNTKK